MTQWIYFPAVPEIWIAVAGLVLLLVGVFRGDGSTRLIGLASMAVLLAALFLTLSVDIHGGRALAFNGLFTVDSFSVYAKSLVLLSAVVSIFMTLTYVEREHMARFEIPLLMLFATAGMMMMISAYDLISLYVGLELQSLALYVVAAFDRDSVRSTEAGLKYFVLGALASGMLLFGASMVYGFAGVTGFEPLQQAFQSGGARSMGLLFCIVFIGVGLAFKVSAVPFHMWKPDVYEGAPTPVTGVFLVPPST